MGSRSRHNADKLPRKTLCYTRERRHLHLHLLEVALVVLVVVLSPVVGRLTLLQ